MSGSDRSRSDPSKAFDIPDLDLPPAAPHSGTQKTSTAPKHAAAPAAPRTDPQAASLDYFGASSFEAEDIGGSLDIETGDTPIGNADAQGLFGAGSFEADDSESGIELHGGAQQPLATSQRAKPSPALREPAPAATQALAHGGSGAKTAEMVAGWGAPPRSIVQAPGYAWRVFMGRRALRARVVALTRALEAAEHDRARALAALAENVRPALEGDERFASLLDPVALAERAAGERQQELASANAEYAAALAKLEANLGPARQEVLQRRAAQTAVDNELARADENAARADAKHKRVLIELRNADEAAGRAAGLPPEAPERIRELGARAAELEAERNAAVLARDEVRARRDGALRASAEAARIVEKLDSERRALEASFGKKLDRRAQDAERADHERRNALAAIGRALLERSGGISLDPTLVAAIRRAEAHVERTTADHELHLRAFDACDEAAVQRGWMVLGALACALFAAVALLVF